MQFLILDVLIHIVNAGLICLVKSRHRKWGCDGGRLLPWPGDRYALCTWPCLNRDRCIRRDLPVAWNRRWKEPVDHVKHEDGETWLQGQIRIVQVKAQYGNPPVILLSCDQQRSLWRNNYWLCPRCGGKLMTDTQYMDATEINFAK